MQNWHGLGCYEENGVVYFVRNDGQRVMQMSKESFVLQSGMLPNPLPRALAKKAALLAVVAASCACAQKVPLYLDVRDQPAWVVDTVNNAAKFWELQDVEVHVGDFDGIKIEVVPERSYNAQWSLLENKIRVSQRLERVVLEGDNAPNCTLAHEIGHALGMGHVEDRDSLMAETASVPQQGCWWSVDDQLELCRVTGCIDEEESEE